MKVAKIILILILVIVAVKNIDSIKNEIKNTFHKDYCIEMYKGNTELINACINK